MSIRLCVSLLSGLALLGCAHVHSEDEALASDASRPGDDRSELVHDAGQDATASGGHREPAIIDHKRDASVTNDPTSDAGRPAIDHERDAAVVGFDPVAVVSTVTSPYATPDDEILILWQIHQPSQQYYPERAVIEGDLERFRVVLPVEPPPAGRIPVDDPETGLPPPNPIYIASGAIYRVVAGKLDANPEGVNALDTDIVIGQTDGMIVWTPVDLPAGWRSGAAALSAGYHLFLNGVEVDLGTLLTLSDDIWT